MPIADDVTAAPVALHALRAEAVPIAQDQVSRPTRSMRLPKRSLTTLCSDRAAPVSGIGRAQLARHGWGHAPQGRNLFCARMPAA